MLSQGQFHAAQHVLSNFKVEMAVRSWDGTPLMLNISEAIGVIKRKMVRGATSNGDLDNDMDTTL